MRLNFTEIIRAMLIFALLQACSVYAVSSGTFIWKGGEKGAWNDGANWESSDESNPFPESGTSYKAIVYINNSVAITNANAIYFSELHIKDGCTVSIESEGRMWAVKNESGEMVFDVGEGAELSIYGKNSTTVYSSSTTGVFAKKGLGKLTMLCNIGTSGYPYKLVEVQAGELDANGKSFRTGDGIKVCADAVLRTTELKMDSGKMVNVQSGGIAEIGSFATARFGGEGTLICSPSGTFSVSNHLAGFSGRLVTRGSATVKAYNPDLASLPSIELSAGTTFNLVTNDVAQNWSSMPALFGEGSATFSSGPGEWLLGNLSLTGSTFTVSSSCAAPSLTLAGGESTNLYLNLENGNFRVNITGGNHHFKRPIWGGDNRTYFQSGGNVRAVICDSENGVNDGLGQNEIFYTITGGTLTSVATDSTYGSSPRVGYGLGLGLDVSGDAYVTLRAAKDASGNINSQTSHVVGNKKRTILRISDNAVVDADALMLFSYWGGAATTGIVDLAGGTLKVSDRLGFINGSSAVGKGCVGKILFRGGMLETGRSAYNVPNYEWKNPDEFLVYVGSDGGKLKVSLSKYSQQMTFRPSTLKPYGDEEDGGLVKCGLGGMIMTNVVNTLTGPFSVYGSQVRLAGIGGEAAWRGNVLASSANVVVDSHDAAASISTLAGAKLAYAGGSALSIPADVEKVTVGNSAASGSSLKREGRGTLVVRVEKKNGLLGTDASLMVNGGVAVDVASGLVAAPIFAATFDTTVGAYMNNRNWMTLSLLRYNSDSGFVAAEPVQGIPEDADGTTVANIFSNSGKLSDNAHVGALSLTHASGTESVSKGPSLTIAEGCTLKIGNGSGSIAPVLLNSVCMNSVDSGAKLLGGTVDFGDAEGVVMVNQSERITSGHLGSSWSKIGSKLKGTGGVTFGSFNADVQVEFPRRLMVSGDNEYSGGTWIENVSLHITKAAALGKDAVTVDGCDTDGGQLVFDADYDGGIFANALVLNGNGTCVHRSSGEEPNDRSGAVKALSSVAVTNMVLLASDASVASAGGEGCELELAGKISGAGKLSVKGDGLAKTRLSGVNTYTGGTLVKEGGWLCVANADALGAGAVKVEEGGVLAFDNPLAAGCANEITGKNVFVDLAGKTVETLPFVCPFPVTNSVESVKAKLRVAGGTSVYTGGDFGDNVQLDILPGAELDLGGGSLAVDYIRGSKRVVNGTLTVRKRDLGDFIGMTVIVR